MRSQRFFSLLFQCTYGRPTSQHLFEACLLGASSLVEEILKRFEASDAGVLDAALRLLLESGEDPEVPQALRDKVAFLLVCKGASLAQFENPPLRQNVLHILARRGGWPRTCTAAVYMCGVSPDHPDVDGVRAFDLAHDPETVFALRYSYDVRRFGGQAVVSPR